MSISPIGQAEILNLAKSRDPERSLQEIFKKRIGIEDDDLFQAVWHQAVGLHNISFKGDFSPLAAKIDEAIRDTLIYHGKGVEFSTDSSNISKIVRYLLGRGVFSVEWLKDVNTKGLLFQKDPELLQGMRTAFRQVLQDAASHLPNGESKEQELVFQAFISNIVALLPYSYPEAGEQFVIPQKIGGEWRVATYTVDRKIPLTCKWFSSPIVAYGLTSPDGPPILSFLGTTYPAGEGFIATLLADFTPGLSVGHAPYLLGRQEIGEWLKDKKGVVLCGASLGGAIAFHTARASPDKIGRVEVFNPPGLYPWNWRGCQNLPEINIYYQNNDLVGTMGFFPVGDKVSVYRVFGEKKENFLRAHSRAYTGGETVTIIKSSPSFENSRISRKILTALHILFSFILFFLPILVIYLLYAFLLRPFLLK